MSNRNRLKRLEKLTGAIDSTTLDRARVIVAAWYACKLERLEQLRDKQYVPPTDDQRALIAKSPYEQIARAFALCVPARRYIQFLALRRTDDAANSSPPDDLSSA